MRSKELHEDVEGMLKDPTKPTTAVCTTTLEMGIDIGAIAQVAQIGPPPSVASLRQRLGRSGRRGEPAILRAYCATVAIDAETSFLDRLQLPLVQTIASIDLLLERWCEPPEPSRLHLSTLIQQLLSLIAPFRCPDLRRPCFVALPTGTRSSSTASRRLSRRPVMPLIGCSS